MPRRNVEGHVALRRFGRLHLAQKPDPFRHAPAIGQLVVGLALIVFEGHGGNQYGSVAAVGRAEPYQKIAVLRDLGVHALAKLNDKTKEFQRILRNRTLRWRSKNGCRSLRLAEIPRAMAAFLQMYL